MSPSSDNLPITNGQRERAAAAHLNPNDPAHEAEAGTPAYGNFGKADETEPAAPVASNDGSNDNPDEFSEFREPTASQNPGQQPNGEPDTPNPGPQRGHAEQNKDPESVVAAKNADADVQRAAWADDDRRYAGGKPKATWAENNDKEHDNN
ncbi:hypothetical protein A0257_20835 [Hymenobacter psoromatis]|nr:hypothetical protein A0257_20835 [Hymenobacter psoromatis]